MEAPAYGMGTYSLDEINYIISTAYTGFAAAVFESHQLGISEPRPVIHTGFWGCGAYGGNRVLMALLQLLAAQLAGSDVLVFHTHTPSGTESFAEATRILKGNLHFDEGVMDVARLLVAAQTHGFQWGASDGN
jgi:hypothetical protein